MATKNSKAIARPENRRFAGARGSAAYGVIDPDYARIYTVIRCLAWQEGYAAMMHGSFTRDLDIVAVPWTDKACEPEHLVARVMASNLNLTEATPGKPGSKPHSRRVWTLMLPEFGDPRFVDLSIVQPQNAKLRDAGAYRDRHGKKRECSICKGNGFLDVEKYDRVEQEDCKWCGTTGIEPQPPMP